MRKDQAPISKFAESRSGSEYTPFHHSSSSTMYGQAETSVKVQNLDAKTDREDSANGEISGMVATGRVCEPRSVR